MFHFFVNGCNINIPENSNKIIAFESIKTVQKEKDKKIQKIQT